MKRYILFLLFFINFIPIYVDGNWFFDSGTRAFAYYEESENWGDNGYYDFGGFSGWDLDDDGYIDQISYVDPDTNETTILGLHKGDNETQNEDWNVHNENIKDNLSDLIPDEPDPDSNPDPGNPDSGGEGGSEEDINPPGGNPDDGYSTSSKTVSSAELKYEVKRTITFVIEKYGKSKPYCNVGVQATFQRIFDSNELNNMCANDMVKYWKNTPAHWQSTTMSKAQELANKGYFVVAGYIAPVGSGHVVVIMPGEMRYSGTWGCLVPNTMDTGINMRSEFQKFSQSFGEEKRDRITFYYYK